MTQTRDDSPLSRFELVVLACTSQHKPPSEAALAKAVQPLCLPDEAPGRARALTADVVGALRRRALVHERKLKLTDDGGRVLCRELGLARTPTWAEVRDVHLAALALGLAPGTEAARVVRGAATIVPAVLRTRFGVPQATTVTLLCDALLAEAVGLPPVPTTLEHLRAHVLARRVGIEAKGKLLELAGRAATLVVGARPGRGGIAKALGRHWARGNADPTGARLAYTAVRDPAASAARPGEGVQPAELGRRLPGSERGRDAVLPAPPPQQPGVRHLELVEPVEPSRERAASAPQHSAPAQHPAPPQPGARQLELVARPPGRGPALDAHEPSLPPEPRDPGVRPVASSQVGNSPLPRGGVGQGGQPEALLEVLRETLPRVGSDGRFGSEKVFVSAIWRSLERDRRLSDLSLDRFKRWLVSANRDGWLVLARADLIGAMDPRQVAESEIEDRGATFHFVLDQRLGAPAAHRGNHV